MGIWDLSKEELNRFIHHTRGDYAERLPPPASRWDNVPVYLEAIKVFFEACFLMLLIIIDFYLWSDVIRYLVNS